MEQLENQIEKTKKIVNDGKIYIDKGCRLSINDTPYQIILENQLIILETLKNLTK